MNIILASGSPRRKEILERLDVKFRVVTSDKEEIVKSSVPSEVVQDLSKMKALDVFEKVKEEEKDNFLIIAADTVVAHEGKILGKPKDEKDAFDMLKSMQGKKHHVYTGVYIIFIRNGNRSEEGFFEDSLVEMCEVTDEEIKKYIATGEPMDKAGAYAIQGRFSPYIKGIEGDYYNIVGFPISRIYRELKKYKFTIA